MKSLAQARVKRTRAVQLLAKGKSYDEIAREVGFSHRGSAHRAVYRALSVREVEAVDDLRQIELARLDRLQAALWNKAMDGDLVDINAILRMMDQRIRLGLERPVAQPDQLVSLVVGPTG